MFSWIVTHPVAYPALEVVHIVGIAMLVGNLLLLELRVWGMNAALEVEALARATLVVALAGFALIATSGLLMFASQPADLIGNRSFLLKIGLIGAAALNAGLFHARGGVRRADGTARLQTALSLGLWLAVIIAGRWIAYA